MFAAVIFDMDGLLIDSERHIMNAWREAAMEHGISLALADYLNVVGRAAADSDPILTSLLGGKALFQQVRARAFQTLQAEVNGPRFPLKAGVVELLSCLRSEGIPCAVASSSPAAEIRHRLDSTGVLEYFSAISGGDEVSCGKPDPAVYNLAAERIGVHPGHCLAFEDSENGALAAIASGAQVVLVPDLKEPAAQIMERSLLVLRSLSEAIAYVPHWFGTEG